ncbi:MAG: hypothetical protein RXR82_06290 [Nitrososphaeria archaeon]
MSDEIIDYSKYMTDTFTVDIDEPYDEFLDRADEFIELLQELQYWGGAIREVWIRKSASGNVHIMVRMKSRHDFLSITMYRALLGDDPVRIRSDLVKLLKGQYGVFMQLWDGKIILQDGKREYRKAGQWRDFFDEAARHKEKLLNDIYRSRD